MERALLGLVTSVHVACGGHAGDDDSMTATVAAALEHGVRVGAHPSYPDRAGFGRAPMEIDRAELGASLADQLRALDRICRTAGTTVDSVKAHGALYEEVAKGGAVYETFRDAVRDSLGEDASLVLPSGCRAMAMALRDGMTACEEGFCDRAYRRDGGLVDRATPGAVLDDPGMAARAGAQPGPRRGGGRRRLRADPVGGHAVHPRRLARRRGHRHGGAPGHGATSGSTWSRRRLHDAVRSPSGRCGSSVTGPS